MKLVRLTAVAVASSLIALGVMAAPAQARDTSWGYVSNVR